MDPWAADRGPHHMEEPPAGETEAARARGRSPAPPPPWHQRSNNVGDAWGPAPPNRRLASGCPFLLPIMPAVRAARTISATLVLDALDAARP